MKHFLTRFRATLRSSQLVWEASQFGCLPYWPTKQGSKTMIVASEDIKVPSGPTTQKHYNAGYRAAMADIAAIVDNAGDKPWETASARLNEIRDWVESNSTVR